MSTYLKCEECGQRYYTVSSTCKDRLCEKCGSEVKEITQKEFQNRKETGRNHA